MTTMYSEALLISRLGKHAVRGQRLLTFELQQRQSATMREEVRKWSSESSLSCVSTAVGQLAGDGCVSNVSTVMSHQHNTV